MKIQYQKEPSLKEEYVEVHYREESEKIKTIRDFFDAFQSITGRKENDIYKLHPESIYYLEVVDRKLFAYQEKEVYQLEYSQENILIMFGLSLLATFVLSQYYRFQKYPLSVVILGQYILLIGIVMLITRIGGWFHELHQNAYRDMFLSFTIPYVIGVIIYYAAVFHEIKSANQALKEIKEYRK